MEVTTAAGQAAEAAAESPLSHLPKAVEGLLHELSTLNVNGESYGATEFVFSNYMFFMLVAVVFLAIVMFVAIRKLALVPHHKLSNAVEALGEFIRTDISIAMIGESGGRKYFPFVATVFFFILANNLIGLIPGCKPGTGTMGITVALSTTVFIFFNAVGFKTKGVWGYIKSFAPAGVPFPINLIVWLIEVFSSFLRIFTLAVRLFANMYAGHIILGIFAILTALFTEPLIEAIKLHEAVGPSLLGALPSLGWLLLMIALYLLEVLVAFVQAYVFTILTAVYIGAAASADH